MLTAFEASQDLQLLPSAEAAQRRFKESGIPLDYHIGPPDPVQAVDEEWAKRQYDEVDRLYLSGTKVPLSCDEGAG